MTPITPHFSLEEAACKDGTPYPVDLVDEEDPQRRTWRESRLLPQALLLEKIRARAAVRAVVLGRARPSQDGGIPLRVLSWFRSLAYDQRIYDSSVKDGSVAKPSKSQHPKGRATDVQHGYLTALELFNLVLEMYRKGEVPELGGIGVYPPSKPGQLGFIHVDTRPQDPPGHLAIWGGSRPDDVA